MNSLRILLLAGFLAGPAAAQIPDLYDEARLHTLELVFAQKDWWEQLRQNYETRLYIKADLKMHGLTLKDVGVRFRGDSSYKNSGSSLKKPFEIATDAFVAGQELHGYTTLNLNNGFKDPTFVREMLAYHVFRQFMPAPRANHVKLVINEQSWGVYVNVQQVNTKLIQAWFRDDSGNRYRGENDGTVPGYQTGLIWLGPTREPYLKSYQLKSPPLSGSWDDLITMIDVLNNTPSSQLPAALPAVLDVDESLWFLAGLSSLLVLDSYLSPSPHNFYLYHDPFHGRFSILPWDLNASFGVDNLAMAYEDVIRLSPFFRETSAHHPLLARLVATPEGRGRYLAHFRTLLDRALDWTVLGPLVAAYQDRIEAEVNADTKKLYPTEHFRGNVTEDVKITLGRFYFFPALKRTVDLRRQFLDQHPDVNRPVPVLAPCRRIPERPGPGQEAWIVVQVRNPEFADALRLHHRVRGGFVPVTMFDDGQHHDEKPGDGIYGARIPPNAGGECVEYYIEASAPPSRGGAVSFLPDRATRAPFAYVVEWPTASSPVILNEFLAVNQSGIRDERDELEDWIELLNTGSAPVALDGHYLTDDISRPTRWRFPAGTTVPAGQTLLIWADDENEGPLHASFKLRGAGESLALFAPDGQTRLDAIAFGPQWPDRSTGRMDGDRNIWVTFGTPSPRSRNLPGPGGHLSYSSLTAHQPLLLTAAGAPRLGQVVRYRVERAPALAPGLIVLGLVPIHLDLAGFGVLLVSPPFAQVPIRTDSAGVCTLPVTVPSDARAVGADVLLQGGAFSPPEGGLSDAILTRISP